MCRFRNAGDCDCLVERESGLIDLAAGLAVPHLLDSKRGWVVKAVTSGDFMFQLIVRFDRFVVQVHISESPASVGKQREGLLRAWGRDARNLLL